ncbi:hypothetical protein J2X11_002575 [Aeromicrobium panaciterrae]|uniref:Ig-like domain repeat protein n=1 Tax=Aeromicrobium panaciterrae TaxID=363861 RepID=A0ABU1URD0_9ACTN|nr:hypothetical protein [Aeromicrobium panaciterrae]MDR7087736.1 hypothetical protein [Aeromicrobium panaciterrae]
MRAIRLLLLALFAFTAIAIVVEPANAAGSKTLQIYHPKPMKNEDFSAYGTLTTPVARQVKLQYRNKNSGSWTTTLSTTSSTYGTFEMVTHSSRSRYYRYYAPSTTVGGHAYAKIVGYSKHVVLASQKVEYAALTPNFVCDYDTGPLTVFVDFSPGRQGRDVSFATPDGTFFRKEDANGRVTFTYTPLQGVGTYHVTATAFAYEGAAGKSTSDLQFSIIDCLD